MPIDEQRQEYPIGGSPKLLVAGRASEPGAALDASDVLIAQAYVTVPGEVDEVDVFLLKEISQVPTNARSEDQEIRHPSSKVDEALCRFPEKMAPPNQAGHSFGSVRRPDGQDGVDGAISAGWRLEESHVHDEGKLSEVDQVRLDVCLAGSHCPLLYTVH